MKPDTKQEMLRFSLDIAEELHDSVCGSGDFLGFAEERDYVEILRTKLAQWTPSVHEWHAKYDEGARLRIEGAIEVYLYFRDGTEA